MFVKKFEANSLESALAQVKKELGPNALILSTQQKRRRWFQKPMVEVTAATEKKAPTLPSGEFDEKELMDIFPHRRYDAVPTVTVESPVRKPIAAAKANKKYSDDEKRAGRAQTPGRVVASERFEDRFTREGFSKESARSLSDRLFHEYSARDLEQPEFFQKTQERLVASGIRVLEPQKALGRGSWVIVGAAGVGKTTLAVKLALLGEKWAKPVALVQTDKRKLSAATELANYARVISVPFAVQPGRHLGKTLLIDTPALPLMENERLRELERLCEGRSVLLVLDAQNRTTEMYRQLDVAARLGVAAIAFTKVDLATQLGGIYDLLMQSRLPLLGLSQSESFVQPFQFSESQEIARKICGRSA